MEFFHGLQQPAWPGGKTNAPAGHGVSLGNTIHGQGSGGQTRFNLSQGEERLVIEYQMLVDVIGQDQHMRVGQQHFGQRLQFGPAVHRAGRVGRRVEDQPAGVRRDCRGEQGRGQFELGITGENTGLAAAQLNHLRVTDPVGRRYDDLVTFVQSGRQGVVDHLFAAAAHQGVSPGHGQAVLTAELCRNGFA